MPESEPQSPRFIAFNVTAAFRKNLPAADIGKTRDDLQVSIRNLMEREGFTPKGDVQVDAMVETVSVFQMTLRGEEGDELIPSPFD